MTREATDTDKAPNWTRMMKKSYLDIPCLLVPSIGSRSAGAAVGSSHAGSDRKQLGLVPCSQGTIPEQSNGRHYPLQYAQSSPRRAPSFWAFAITQTGDNTSIQQVLEIPTCSRLPCPGAVKELNQPHHSV